MDKLKTYGLLAFGLAALFSAIWMWYHPREIYVPGPTVWRDVTVKGSSKKVVCTETFHGEQPAGAGQPEQPRTDDLILAEGRTEPTRGGFDLKAVLQPASGEVKIEARERKRALFGLEDEKEVGIRYNGARAGVFGRWTFVRIGSIYGALYAEANTKPDSQVMFEASYRW